MWSGVEGADWARLAVARRTVQASVAMERMNMAAVSLSWISGWLFDDETAVVGFQPI
jgi:hypothetical protein